MGGFRFVLVVVSGSVDRSFFLLVGRMFVIL